MDSITLLEKLIRGNYPAHKFAKGVEEHGREIKYGESRKRKRRKGR